MTDPSAEILRAICEIRDLVRLLAEPAIAERDQNLRLELRKIVGRSEPKRKAVLLMDGSRSQRVIHQESGIHEGQLSTLVKELNNSRLLSGDAKNPKLAISIPGDFFERKAADER